MYDRCMARNSDFTRPMDSREIYQIAKSVAKWTWQRFDIEASDRRFSQLQAHRGKKAMEKRWENSLQNQIRGSL